MSVNCPICGRPLSEHDVQVSAGPTVAMFCPGGVSEAYLMGPAALKLCRGVPFRGWSSSTADD